MQFRDLRGQPVELVLYKYDSCRYCARVMRRAAELGIELPTRDTLREPEAREELIRVGGKSQVPCLFINGVPLYESKDIIAYLEREVVAV